MSGLLERAKGLHSAMVYLKPIYGTSTVTGMYRCQDIEELLTVDGNLTDGAVLEDMNLCAVCVSENDDCFTDIMASTYDGDCDECGGDALPYVLLELTQEEFKEYLESGNNG